MFHVPTDVKQQIECQAALVTGSVLEAAAEIRSVCVCAARR